MRGSRAVYIHARGRCSSGGSPLSNPSSQETSPAIEPSAPSGPMRASPTFSHCGGSERGAAAVTFAARGPSGSNSVNQSEPVGGAPGRLWTV